MVGPGSGVAIELKNSHRCRIQYNDISEFDIGIKLSNNSSRNIIAYNDFTNVGKTICSEGGGARNRGVENTASGTPVDASPNNISSC
jgi:parallel beta-helix repeat protein